MCIEIIKTKKVYPKRCQGGSSYIPLEGGSQHSPFSPGSQKQAALQ